jgi:hypothetical protein
VKEVPLLQHMQVLFSLPEVAERYVNNAQAIFATTPSNPSDDLPTQMAKVGTALVKGRTGNPPPLPDAATAPGPAVAAAANAGPGAGPEPMDTSEVAAVAAADTAAAVAASGQPLDAANAGRRGSFASRLAGHRARRDNPIMLCLSLANASSFDSRSSICDPRSPASQKPALRGKEGAAAALSCTGYCFIMLPQEVTKHIRLAHNEYVLVTLNAVTSSTHRPQACLTGVSLRDVAGYHAAITSPRVQGCGH